MAITGISIDSLESFVIGFYVMAKVFQEKY